MTVEQYQKEIFGDNLYDVVPTLNEQRVAATNFLDEQTTLCAAVSLDDYFIQREKILSAEETLERLFPTTKELCLQAIETNQNIGRSYFLSDSAVERLLYAHPPTTLQRYMQNAPTQKLPARAMLSLTRFTEDAVWQFMYLKLLNETSEKDYQLRYPEYYQIEADLYAKVIGIHDHHIKPWRVSHAKETGAILHFTTSDTQPGIQTPILLSGAVALHYLFEVSYFGRYVKHRIENKLPLTVEKIILNKTPILPFLTDGNAHDETLYWRQTWSHFADSVLPDLEEITDKQGIAAITDSVHSFHPVDLLWDINAVYPNKKNKYHLQQEVWLTLLQRVSDLPNADFEKFITSNLTQDNQMFAESACKAN